MVITRVAGNLKGGQFEFEPRGVNIVLGPNFSGKTAVHDALLIGLLGEHPKLGKRPSALFQLSDGNSMSVEIDFQDGSQLVREYVRNKDSAKVERESVPFLTPPALMDITTYFKMTASERLLYLFSQLDVSDRISKDGILAKIQGIEPAKESTAQFIKARAGVVKLASGVKGGDTIQGWIELALKALQDRKKVVDAGCKSHAGFARTQTELRAEQDEAEAAEKNARAKMKDLQEKLAKVRVEVSDADREYSEASRKFDRLAVIKKQLSELSNEDFEKQIADIEAKVKSAEEELAAMPEPEEEPKPSEKLATTVRELSSEKVRLETELRNADRNSKELKGQEEDVSGQIMGFSELQSCPKCGAGESRFPSWREKVLTSLQAEYDAINKKMTIALADLIGLREQLDEVNEELVSAQAAVGKEKKSLEAARQKRVQDQGERYEKVQQIQALNRTLSSVREKKDSVGAVAHEVSALTKELDGVELPALCTKIKLANEKASVLNGKIVEAEKSVNKEIAARHEILQRQQSADKAAELTAELEVLKAAIKLVAEMQEQVLKTAVEPMLQVARQFTDGILREPLAWNNSEIGYWHGKVFVPHRAFSGTEEALAYAGLSVALAQTSPVKLIMIDEMARFDREVNRKLVMERMLELTSNGTIDHFVGADTDEQFYADNGYLDHPNVCVVRRGDV